MLKALLAVADTGNVTKASAQLHLVQPAVSRQIKLLEEAFGARLFDRSPHGMVLTAAGEILAGHARRILDELSEARYKISASVQQVSGSVTLGMLPCV
ncbi:LysR family transcriptional regulator [Pluralibacter gergoviae]|uniref:LysR family transcriptional regulator n=1 Tax=Pluralibacter gergoviae TaxID=61647 RepID=A0AAW8HU60_PLUGE|nr:LysR family transcriptional regulator [Pluralibacter gergoviae]AVR04891.1 LysR family transcriptional regulator [Pluralibacter gergoviae]MDQ2310781.1 LysR family transcriptional regulator [Pluralibacter gergoviae]